MTWTERKASDDGQLVQIERVGPRAWELRHHGKLDDRFTTVGTYRTRAQAIEAASERYAVHPRHWAE